MSEAGIQSNRGDGYQTLVAFDFALNVLSDPDYEWIEIDSVISSVDDVIVGKSNGEKICCQCKKNQTRFRAWSFSDLKDELIKAIALLTKDSTAKVRFYSRSNFGDLHSLWEYARNYPDEGTFKGNLGKAQGETENDLSKLLAERRSSLSSYDFLRRTEFEVSPSLERMKEHLRGHLRLLVSNQSAAYNALWTRLDYLGMRETSDATNETTRHRLTKSDLKAVLHEAGAMLAPPVDMREIRAAFRSVSAIGRSWRREIARERLPSHTVTELLELIEEKSGSILLVGSPGCGKTCVMLAVQEQLEALAQQRNNLLTLFIQTREFADRTTADEREALGLSKRWVELVARASEEFHVVVMLDSLDVLSIARERGVLDYFLVQIDRLSTLPNVTVVTACREFDSRYDQRIARRSWNATLACRPWDWKKEVEPLLSRLGIDVSIIDAVTRELIRNPRELALFVELAQQKGSFSIPTSQALAQRYLDIVVESDVALGDAAIRAIESVASEMLRSRVLSIPEQRFNASGEIKRALLSNDILHETHDKRLTFGHQTLLDVLVIGGALRRGQTLNAFIRALSPVPFVRPSIRSFAQQLATVDRRDFRKQVRTVLTGNHAFHIRRLVAEIFAEHAPNDDDWSLLRDLRTLHRKLFQVIYQHGVRLEWHFFWMKHLVPVLKETRDIAGIAAHVNRVAQWIYNDTAGVLEFWTEALAQEGADQERLAIAMTRGMTEIQPERMALCASLLTALLDLPKHGNHFLGKVLARCAEVGGVDDTVLWRYIAGEVVVEDVCAHRIANKLHCQAHEFGNSNRNFLAERMLISNDLLELAAGAIERWGEVRSSRYGRNDYWGSFLDETSYADVHNKVGLRHVDSVRILMDAVEAAVISHAKSQSPWWLNNREKLAFNKEEALRYFAILACTASPEANLALIGRMLCEKEMLESSLSYELGMLMQSVFIDLEPVMQDAIEESILNIHRGTEPDSWSRTWILRAKAQLLLAIPRHLRSPEAEAVLCECEKSMWPVVRQPSIRMQGGWIGAPFSFEVFLDAADEGVFRILDHYAGYDKDFDGDLVGGMSHVGSQLGEAASRHPERFLLLLSERWDRIFAYFRESILNGVASHLAYCYGNVRPIIEWTPIFKPDAAAVARRILDELERHPEHWHHNRDASRAIESCAYVVATTEDADRLVSLAEGFSTVVEESPHFDDSPEKLINEGINMIRGRATEALMILANRLDDHEIPWPEALPNALRLFAADENLPLRALMLRRLPVLQSRRTELGWELFGLLLRDNAPNLWHVAEHCLYYAYPRAFEIVAPWLARLYREGRGRGLEAWGRISALAVFSKRVDLPTFLAELAALKAEEAWRGAASVWTHPRNMLEHREECIAGLEAAFSADAPYAAAVAREIHNLFRGEGPPIFLPVELLRSTFRLLETETDYNRRDILDFDVWLNATSRRDPLYALEVAEIFFDYVRRAGIALYDHEHNLTQMLTRLFAQAEEEEESDDGAMLRRVVKIQDAMLFLNVYGMDDWLKAAERP